MPIEVEAKMAVPDVEPVRATLKRLNATRGGLTLETNVFFDTKDQTLLKAGRGLRVRTNHDAATGRETHVVTHKGPLLAGGVKSREETELTVESAAAAAALFAQLGFGKTLTFQKRRESWKLQACKIELDELPHLGWFVEVEGPDEATVMRVREALGLADRPIIKTSYVGMLADHLAERGEPTMVVTFPGSSSGSLVSS
jgi:predicted adenylyl cyclase CyaB